MGYIATIVIMIIMFPQLKERTITLGFFLAFVRVTLNMNNIMQYKVKTLLDIMSGQQIFWREYNELIETVEKEDIEYEGGSKSKIGDFTNLEGSTVDDILVY